MHRRVPTGIHSSWVGGQHCGRQFVNNPSRQPISQEKRDLIDKLLKERWLRRRRRRIARLAEVSERW